MAARKMANVKSIMVLSFTTRKARPCWPPPMGRWQMVFAGDDGQTLLAWVPAFYGNVIVLEHLLAGEKLYTLYGHLSRVGVSIGQAVKTGEPIGEVGASGTAIGSHLHFEVRRGANDYFSTRNP